MIEVIQIESLGKLPEVKLRFLEKMTVVANVVLFFCMIKENI